MIDELFGPIIDQSLEDARNLGSNPQVSNNTIIVWERLKDIEDRLEKLESEKKNENE